MRSHICICIGRSEALLSSAQFRLRQGCVQKGGLSVSTLASPLRLALVTSRLLVENHPRPRTLHHLTADPASSSASINEGASLSLSEPRSSGPRMGWGHLGGLRRASQVTALAVGGSEAARLLGQTRKEFGVVRAWCRLQAGREETIDRSDFCRLAKGGASACQRRADSRERALTAGRKRSTPLEMTTLSANLLLSCIMFRR